MAAVNTTVIPAKAGIQIRFETVSKGCWIPAFAGLTMNGGDIK